MYRFLTYNLIEIIEDPDWIESYNKAMSGMLWQKAQQVNDQKLIVAKIVSQHLTS